MLEVSGIVPNGVPAAFLTAPDGTAVRADVKDNAYLFVVPRAKTAEQRYVVWTGGDGTPHVQPLTPTPFQVRCPKLPEGTQLPPVVSPDGASACGLLPFARTTAILPASPATSRRLLRPNLFLSEAAPCALATPLPAPIPFRPPHTRAHHR
jgi:hypothetical protein